MTMTIKLTKAQRADLAKVASNVPGVRIRTFRKLYMLQLIVAQDSRTVQAAGTWGQFTPFRITDAGRAALKGEAD